MTKPHVVVGLSGGVDSSVAALLLKKQGYRVTGLFMKNWEEDDTSGYCAAEADFNDAQQVCTRLDIPLETVNFSTRYWDKVFEIFLREYAAGRTPNPDILCNKEIKFRAFLEYAQQLGADGIATGHYVQKGGTAGAFTLGEALDSAKDQSYFLYTLQQDQLAHSLFPLGHLTKSEVRKLAAEHHFVTHNKKDSTGICFIGERRFKSFLSGFLPAQPGDIRTPEGTLLGKHEGLMYTTLGQRQGLGIGGQKNAKPAPWYVVAKDLRHNCLIVTQDPNHPGRLSTEASAVDPCWVNPPPSHFKAEARCRYRQKRVPCTVTLDGDNVNIIFDTPQRDVTPGQAIVFYEGNLCLGGATLQQTNAPGGLITQTHKEPRL